MLQRMRELAVQAANGAVSGSDRVSIQLEIDELKAEINSVAERTNFNGIKLLDGTARDVKLQTGTNEGELMSVGFNSVKTTEIGSGDNPALTSFGQSDPTAMASGDLTINGVLVGASLAADDASSLTNPAKSAIAKVAAINRVSDASGVYAKVDGTTVLGTSMAAAAVSGAITINGTSTSTFTTTSDASISRATAVDAINNISAQTGVVAIDTGDDTRGVLLFAEDGRNVTVAYVSNMTAAASGVGTDATTTGGTFSLYSTTGQAIVIGEEVGGSVQNAGLRQGTYEVGLATMVTKERAEAANTAPTTATTGVLNSTTLVINDINIDKAIATDDNASFETASSTKAASAIAIAAAINKKSDLTGVTAKADANILRGDGTFTADTGSVGSINLNGVAIQITGSTRDAVIETINLYSGRTGVEAQEFGAGIQLVAEDGRNIAISHDGDVAEAGFGLNGLTITDTSAAGYTTFYSTVSLSSDKAFEVRRGSEGDGNFEKLGFREGTFGGSDTGVKIAEIDVTTQLGAGIAITAIDNAIEDVSSAQARSGAFQNRLDAAVSILSESSENASAARSRIVDTDYATETTALAKAQIVQQAATAMLAQANQQAQSVLALLQ
jgi:flagellin